MRTIPVCTATEMRRCAKIRSVGKAMRICSCHVRFSLTRSQRCKTSIKVTKCVPGSDVVTSNVVPLTVPVVFPRQIFLLLLCL